MYERSAILLERYFDSMFGYDMKSNLRTNFKDYSELVECLSKYKKASEEEDIVMQEYEIIATKIKEIQKTQETLNKKNNKLQEKRENIFENIDERAQLIQKKFNDVQNEINSVNEQINENADKFIETIAEFNEKSNVRTEVGRVRRKVESEYNRKLNETLDNYQKIDIEHQKIAKNFSDMPKDDIEAELKEKMLKNGEKENIPFNSDIINKAVKLYIDIQRRETEVLSNIYEKSNRLFIEIKNNTSKIERHKKVIKDSRSRLNFQQAIKEYIIQFLDNERLTIVSGAEEHKKLMEEACKNLDEDLKQISNLYELLQREINKKVLKKSYYELYNIGYLKNLEKKSEQFDEEVKKLNLTVTIINPNYWRIQGMQKIYETFNTTVVENYGRDLTPYISEQNDEMDYEEDDDDDIIDIIDIKSPKKTTKKVAKKSKQIHNDEEIEKDEIDKKIDKILGFGDDDDDWDDDEQWEKQKGIEENKLEDVQEDDSDDWDNNWNSTDWDEDDSDRNEETIFIKERKNSQENIDDDFDEEDDEEDFKKKYDEYYNNYENEEDDDDEDDIDDWDDEDEDDEDYDDENDDEEEEKDDDDSWHSYNKIKENKIKEKIKKSQYNKRKNTSNDGETWGNEFIRFGSNDIKNDKKKVGFFGKFKNNK